MFFNHFLQKNRSSRKIIWLIFPNTRWRCLEYMFTCAKCQSTQLQSSISLHISMTVCGVVAICNRWLNIHTRNILWPPIRTSRICGACCIIQWAFRQWVRFFNKSINNSYNFVTRMDEFKVWVVKLKACYVYLLICLTIGKGIV
jgi:hypothetical protein